MNADLSSGFREILRIVRFGFVGVIATLIYAVVAYLSAKGRWVGPLTATTLGYAAAFVVSYFGHLRCSFSVAPDHRVYLWRFVLVTAVTFGFSLCVTWVVTDVMRLSYAIAIFTVAIFVPPTSYLCNRFWVFMPGLKSGQPGALSH